MKVMEPLADKGESFEVRDLSGRFVLGTIASIIFGQDDISTIQNPEHDFRVFAIKLGSNFVQIVRIVASFVCPG